MKQLLNLCLFVLALTFGCQGTCKQSLAFTANVRVQERTAILANGLTSNQTDRDRLTDGVHAIKHESQEATISDGQHAHRICYSRPQRLLPAHSVKPDRLSTRLQVFSSRSIHSFLFLSGRIRRSESAPFQSFASNAYYVYALRRILC